MGGASRAESDGPEARDETAGVPAKVVSEVLGYASTAITLDLYSHVAPGMLEESAATVAALNFPG